MYVYKTLFKPGTRRPDFKPGTRRPDFKPGTRRPEASVYLVS